MLAGMSVFGDRDVHWSRQQSGSGQTGFKRADRKTDRATAGRFGGSVGFDSNDTGTTSETAQSSLDIVSYDVRGSIAAAERAAARSNDPAATFSRELSKRVLGSDGMRNRYLQDADNGRATFDITGPLTSLEQNPFSRRGAFRLISKVVPVTATAHSRSAKDACPCAG
jgi:conjugal transfer mating pair stabilization protein TraG